MDIGTHIYVGNGCGWLQVLESLLTRLFWPIFTFYRRPYLRARSYYSIRMSVSSDQAEDAVVAEDQTMDSSDEEEPAAVEVAAEELAADEDHEDDEANEEVMAAVVVEDEDEGEAQVVVEEEEEEDAVAVPVAPVKTPKKKKKVSAGGGKKKDRSSMTPGSNSTKKKKGKKKRPREQTMHFARISSSRMNAAEAAREMLIQTVPRLPVKINETHTVRNFGHLRLEPAGEPVKFCSANTLHPVGFSCDRFEFSPAHGRVLKMRCSILDGTQIKENQADLGMDSDDFPEGPIFRVMWGQGIDEDTDKVDYPYDIYSNSSPVSTSDKVDAVAIAAAPGGSGGKVVPEEGMRVQVRFDSDQFYHGSITSVKEKETEKGKKKKKKAVEISIRYDDGSTEAAVFPDPDITLVMPGKFSDKLRFCASAPF